MPAKKHPRYVTTGGYGRVNPAPFALDLTGAALAKGARLRGVARYGQAPGSGSDDTRPHANAYRLVRWNNTLSSFSRTSGTGAALRQIKNTAGADVGLNYTDATPNQKSAWSYSQTLGKNEGFTYRNFICEKDKTQSLALDWLKWGTPGAGYIFQIRNGRAEFAGLSSQWNATDETTLRTLWALASPSAAETAQALTLQNTIYSDFESLSLENGTGRDAWVESLWTLSFIPEGRGLVHLALEGGDATAHENSALLATRTVGALWNAGAAIEVGTMGGAFLFEMLKPAWQVGVIEHGPFYGSSSEMPEPIFSSNIDASAGSISYVLVPYAPRPEFPNTVLGNAEGRAFDETLEGRIAAAGTRAFGLRATLTPTSGPVWLYALGARTAPGVRDGGAVISFDSDAIPNFPRPIMDVQTTVERDGSRKAIVLLHDMRGQVSTTAGTNPFNVGPDAIRDRVSHLSLDNEPLFTDAITLDPTWQSAARVGYTTLLGSVIQTPAFTAKAKTVLVAPIRDGRAILEETFCDPAPVGDGLPLGSHIADLFALAGQDGELCGGKWRILPRAAAGEPFAVVPDGTSTVAAAIDSLLERFGLGLRCYQRRDGRWVLEAPPSVSLADFTSQNIVGGYAVLEELDWIRDNSNFFNFFKVIGGEDGREIVATYFIEESISNQSSPNWIGRLKAYPTLRDSGLRTLDDVKYALRSLVWKYGRIGRFYQFESYYHSHLMTGDLITVHGKLCEIYAIDSSSLRANRMQINAREII